LAILCSIQNLSKSFGSRTLFEKLSFGLFDGERLGLIGPNGSGKSTLLKILAGQERQDEGTLNFRRGLRLAYLPQREDFSGPLAALSVEQALTEALTGEHLEDYEKDLRVGGMLAEMEFENPGQTVASLSGGWKKRLALARLLVREPDLVLMDEPTNHMDLEGILWLEKLLQNASFAFCVVSHDRYFLEAAANRVVELNRVYPEGCFSVQGNYSRFLEKKQEFLAAQSQQEEAVANRLRREQEWLARGPKARGTKQQARIKAAGELAEEHAGLRSRNAQGGAAVQIDFSASERRTKQLLVAEGLGKAMGGKKLFEEMDFFLGPGSKLGLMGPNGSGKTTFFKLVTGELEPDAGRLKKAEGLKVVQFDQNRAQLKQDASLRENLADSGDYVHYRGRPIHLAAWAKRFLFRHEQLEMPLKQLSGGEQSRVLIARLMLREADILLLDEPTNDLDIPSLEVLEESLLDFPGCLILITHDRFLLDRVSDRILALDGQGHADFFADYWQWESRPKVQARSEKTPPKPEVEAPREKNRLSYKEQKELEGMESAIEAAETSVKRMEAEVAQAASAGDHKKLASLTASLQDTQQDVERLYQRWQELQGREAAQKISK
jgi:ATP-binding cassette subfamily F protein uup